MYSMFYVLIRLNSTKDISEFSLLLALLVTTEVHNFILHEPTVRINMTGASDAQTLLGIQRANHKVQIIKS